MLGALPIALMLSGCAPATFNTAQSAALILPPLISYDPELLKQAADEAEKNTCQAHVELGKDYLLTRDRIRIAKEKLGKN